MDFQAPIFSMPHPKDLRYPVVFPRLRYYVLQIVFQCRQQILDTDGEEKLKGGG